MQRYRENLIKKIVVFTFQKEGRCNYKGLLAEYGLVVFTFQKEGRCNPLARKSP